ncbi:MAG TPA: SP_1767 family glycosyltransferase [Candidatus Paceibacterota bacterium]|nr:SP_1767 family glycosyltransferase [Candidatus Paceibacterota bacterium]HMO82764.1 SP_1767 family glycosyltransferase [Candidatus Paceibacterota bacterium]
MKKRIHQKIIDSIRKSTPLFLRQLIGPVLAELFYLDRIYIRPNQKKPIILSLEQTIEKIKKEKLSVIRFGDGEIFIIDGGDLMFQHYNKDLALQLEEIIKSDDPNLLICVPGIWNKLNQFEDYASRFIKHQLYRYKSVWGQILTNKKVYGDAYFSRNYLSYKDKSKSGEIFTKIFTLWEKEKVILIEGEKSRLGVGNDLFDNVTSLERILAPAENAYSRRQEIMREVEKHSKDKMILLSLGPAAKVIAYNLFKQGYRVIDIGHIDMEYEMYLRKSYKQVAVPYKYFNEIHARNPEDCKDKVYLSQIIKKVV